MTIAHVYNAIKMKTIQVKIRKVTQLKSERTKFRMLSLYLIIGYSNS